MAATIEAGAPVAVGGVYWYVTASHVAEFHVGGGSVLLPVSTAHAKRQGTMTTACGLWAYSWRKLLDLPFPAPPQRAPGVDMCRECLRQMDGDR